MVVAPCGIKMTLWHADCGTVGIVFSSCLFSVAATTSFCGGSALIYGTGCWSSAIGYENGRTLWSVNPRDDWHVIAHAEDRDLSAPAAMTGQAALPLPRSGCSTDEDALATDGRATL